MKRIGIALLFFAFLATACGEEENPGGNNPGQGENNNPGQGENNQQPNKTDCDCQIDDNACADKCIYATCKCSDGQDRLDCAGNCYATTACNLISVNFGMDPFNPNFDPFNPGAFDFSIDVAIKTQSQLDCIKQELQDSVNKATNGESCSNSSNCVSGYCNGSGKCATMPAEKLENGSTCESNDDCKSGYCDNSGTCSAPQTNKSNGDNCTASSECKSGYCNESGKCAEKSSQPDTPKENGESCSANSDCKSSYCNDSGKCAEKSSQPDTPKENGESCMNNQDCKSHFCNNDGKCDDASSLKSNGTECSKHEECASGLCLDSKCSAKLKFGEGCIGHQECESEFCTASHRCGISNLQGLTCTSDNNCKSYGTDLHCDTVLNYCDMEDPCADVSCASGEKCYMGVCVSSSIKAGAPCIEGRDEVCGKGVALHCVNGIYESESCASMCTFIKGNKEAVCVTPKHIPFCAYFMGKYGMEAAYVCTDDKTGFFVAGCYEAVNGIYYPLQESEINSCPNGTQCKIVGNEAVCE